MNKKLIALAVASAIAAPVTSAYAVDVSGFVDANLVIIDEAADNTAGPTGTDNPNENQFSANGEVDFTHTAGAVTVRADVDLSTSTTASGSLEQAYAAWQINPMLTAIGGVFNNPVGQDAEDIVDQRFSSHSAVYSVLDHQTGEFVGNNVAGVALTGMMGPVTVTGAVLNDIGNGHGSSSTAAAGGNSLALNASVSPSQIPGLNVEFGFVSQEDYDAANNPLSAGNVFDINASYDWMNMVEVGFDYLNTSDVVDGAYDVWVKGNPGMGVELGLRYSSVGWDSAVFATSDDNTATTIYAAYSPASNLEIAFEYTDGTGNTAASAGSTTTANMLNKISGIDDGAKSMINVTGTF